MKRRLPLWILLLLPLLLAGCATNTEYLSLTPHVEQYTQPTSPTEADPIPVVTNRPELRGAILSLIDTWQEQGIILIRDYDGDVEQNLSEVMNYATREHPTGAYAVDYADAEIVEEDGQQMVQVSFVFRRSPSEINSIVLVDNNVAAYAKIKDALCNYNTALTLRIRHYSDWDFEDAIVGYCMENPRLIPAIPEFSLKLYPEEGEHRIMELHFTYPESKDSMRGKLADLETPLQSALSYGRSGDSPRDRAQRMGNYLIRRQDQVLTDTAPTMPVYSLLADNIGHDLSYAVCYNDLCASLGIRSYIIRGTKNGEPYYWNFLQFGEEAFHVDLRYYVENGITSMYPLYDEDLLSMGYTWDQDSYTAASVTPYTETVPDATESTDSEVSDTPDS